MADDRGAGTWVTFEQGHPTTLQIRRCRLEVVDGPDAGLTAEFGQPAIRIGGGAGADFRVGDSQVSRLHCEIVLEDEGYLLRDLQSTNGTFVGGHRAMEVFIGRGSVIRVGETNIRFEPLSDAVGVSLSSSDRFGGLVGTSAVMRELFARLEKIAATDTTVLVTGETGTGKDLAAEAIHGASPRADGPFSVVDCGSISPNLIESEIFGHEKGAFTGATSAHAGAFERAHGGTLFFDEIGELPLDLQPKLLRVLERKQIRRVGGSAVLDADVRLIAATNRDLRVEVNRGRFREDLYYRLAVAHVHLRPLRERADDIPVLVEHFLSQLPGAEQAVIGGEALALMMKHDWPGNARELRNVIERAALLDEPPSSVTAIRERDDSAPAGDGNSLAFALDVDVPLKQAKQQLIDEFERRYVTELMQRHGDNVSAAARAAGVDRMTITKIIERLGLRRSE